MSDPLQTRWSLLDLAIEGHSDALGEVYESYFLPLAAFAQFELSIEAGQAEEYVQDFLTKAILEKNLLKSADRSKGKFRNYLKTAFRNHVYQTWRHDGAKIRSPELMASLDRTNGLEISQNEESLSQTFEKAWALETLMKAIRRWKQECRTKESRSWELYMVRVLNPVLEGLDPPTYETIYRKLGYKSSKAAMNALVNANRAILRHLRSEFQHQVHLGLDLQTLVAQRVDDRMAADEHGNAELVRLQVKMELNEEIERTVDDEIRELREVLSAPPAQRRAAQMRRPISVEKPRGDLGSKDDHPPSEEEVSQHSNDSSTTSSSVQAYVFNQLSEHVARPIPQSERCPEASFYGVVPNPAEVDLRRLAELFLDYDKDTAPTWHPEELARSLQRQMDRPIESNAGRMADGPSYDGEPTPGWPSATAETLGDLLQHPEPTVELLIAAKESARNHRQQEDEANPPEVATAIYFACIAAAMLRHGERITTLDDRKLADGFQWILGRPWIDGRMRQLIEDASAELA